LFGRSRGAGLCCAAISRLPKPKLSTLNSSSSAQKAFIRLSLICLIGCLGAFNTQVRISRLTPQPNSTNYLIGASRMISERFDLALEDQSQTPVEDYDDQLHQTPDLYQAKALPFPIVPVRALALTLPLTLSLRAPPQLSA